MKPFERIAAHLAGLIEAGVLRPGERLPSTRALAGSHRVSPATATRALYLLEDRGVVQARPRSGFYVSAHGRETAIPEPIAPAPTTPTFIIVRERLVIVWRGKPSHLRRSPR